MKPGDRVADRYRIERELGKGGMGAVYEATDTRKNLRVALKVAAVAGRNVELFRARFRREAKIGGYFGVEEGLVRARSWGELPGGRLFLTMDLVPGARPLDMTSGSRAERLKRMVRAAELVCVLHELGVMHRDVKPDNFLVDSSGRMHLSDFGLAKPFRGDEADLPELSDTGGAHTQSGVGIGTPIVMPPEQFKDLASVDARVDVYALGVMLYQALTGELPYAGSAPQVVQKQMKVALGQEPAPSPRRLDPSVHDSLDAVCCAALELDREARPQDAIAFVAQLRAAIRGEYTPRRTAGRRPKAARRSDRSTARAEPSDRLEPITARRPPPRPPTVGGFRPSEPRRTSALKSLLGWLGVWSLRLLAVAAVAAGLALGYQHFLRPPPKPGFTPYSGESTEVRALRERVIQAEDPDDMFQLGRRLAEGEGVDPDPRASRHWWVEAATRGQVSAMERLGELYADRDREQAIYWLSKAARKGSLDAERALKALEAGAAKTAGNRRARR